MKLGKTEKFSMVGRADLCSIANVFLRIAKLTELFLQMRQLSPVFSSVVRQRIYDILFFSKAECPSM